LLLHAMLVRMLSCHMAKSWFLPVKYMDARLIDESDSDQGYWWGSEEVAASSSRSNTVIAVEVEIFAVLGCFAAQIGS